MAIGVTRDHHNLRRNLKLNGNYISNDGGDEGISISDTGLVTISTNQLTIDRNVTSTDAGDYIALDIDFDKTGASSAGTNNIYGYRINVLSDEATAGINIAYGMHATTTLQHASDTGTALCYGAHFRAISSSNGSNSVFGVDIKASGGDTNYGIRINCEDGGNDLRILSSTDTGDYFQLKTGALGATIISTVDDGDSGDGVGADLTLSIDGYIDMNSASGENITLDSGNDIILDANTGITKFYLAGATDDYAKLTVAANGATTIASVDASGSLGADLTLDADGSIILDAQGNIVDIKDGGTGIGSIIWTTSGGEGAQYMKLRAAGTTHHDLILESQGTDADIILDSKTGIVQFQVDSDTDDLCILTVAANGATTIATADSDGAVGHLTLDPDGDINLNAIADVNIPANIGLTFGDAGEKIEGNGSQLSIASSSHLTVDAGGTIILDSATGAFEMHGAGTTAKFADMYAGMILGYTDIGLDEAHASLLLTTVATGYVIPTDEFSVAFVIPPSGNVLIEFQIQYGSGSSGAGTLHAGLSTTNKTTKYTQLEDFHEKLFDDTGSRNGIQTVNGSWTLTGLTAGDSEELWIAFASQSVTGSPTLYWGASSSGRYPDFIMKATALPASITT